MSESHKDPRAVANGSKGGRVKGKRHFFAKFNLKDLAKAIHVSYWSLLLYLKDTSFNDLKKMPLDELVDWIVLLRTKRPLNTKIKRSRKQRKSVIKTATDTWDLSIDEDPDAPF